MSNYYHVRISNIKKNPFNDYNIFLKNVELKSEAVWDKDRYNKIKINDYIGFIVGDVKNAMVHIYKVKSEVDRENHWEQDRPYTTGNGINSVKHRNGIVLINAHNVPTKIEWAIIKKCIEFAPDNEVFMPRGMSIVKNKQKLPFKL